MHTTASSLLAMGNIFAESSQNSYMAVNKNLRLKL